VLIGVIGREKKEHASMTTDGTSNSARLKSLFVDVIAPILLPGRQASLAPDLPRRALEVLDGIGDLEATGDEILSILEEQGAAGRAGGLLAGGDVIAKSGRTVSFRISGSRAIDLPGSPVSIRIEGPFALEFRSAAESFEDRDVQSRFESARASLPDAEGADILAAAVLPQTKTLLGVGTPLRASLLGIPFCLRFGILLSRAGRLRLFAAGPIVKEVPL
jgi:hypothetical protein